MKRRILLSYLSVAPIAAAIPAMATPKYREINALHLGSRKYKAYHGGPIYMNPEVQLLVCPPARDD